MYLRQELGQITLLQQPNQRIKTLQRLFLVPLALRIPIFQQQIGQDIEEICLKLLTHSDVNGSRGGHSRATAADPSRLVRLSTENLRTK